MDKGSIAQWIGLGLTMLGAGMGYGAVQNQVSRNSDDIRQIKAEKIQDSTALGVINERTARIEAKLEILLPTSAVREIQR